MSDDDIFYPNKLKKKDIEKLDGWKLKIAVLHFGQHRGDCVRFGYGYKMMKSDIWADKPTIHLVADRDGLLKKPIDLGDEIEWDNEAGLLVECGVDIKELFRGCVERAILKEDKK